MSLATRCTACGTIFRVVQEQLKTSEGWVRCGRCDDVFNAIEGLFDLERDAPPDWTPPPETAAPPAAVITATFTSPSTPPDNGNAVLELGDDDRIHSRFFQPEQEHVNTSPAQNISERDRVDFADARFNDEMVGDTGPGPIAPPPASQPKRIGSPRKGKKPPPAKAPRKVLFQKPAPEFVQAATRQARWHSLEVRFALGAALLVLALLLLAQIALHNRDNVAARWPSTQPVLSAWCRWLGCSVELPRAINQITIESSALSPASGVEGYRLTVVLRNRTAVTVATPWLDLTISDSQGQTIARRTLSPQHIAANPALPPGVDVTLPVLLSTDSHQVSGYTVEVFYP
jgi:predicted Zn finger-like uncharacterized protein